ncbi:MAG: hypothetical protein WCE90_04395 [Candidatus Zixiibacteriota bacterium]
MNQEPASRRPLVFRKIRPRYRKALIVALIISFIVAVILLLFLNQYLFKPVLERRGSLGLQSTEIVMSKGQSLGLMV